MTIGALIYALFFAEFEFWGKPYKPSEEVHPTTTRRPLTETSLTTLCDHRLWPRPPISSASWTPTNATNEEKTHPQ